MWHFRQALHSSLLIDHLNHRGENSNSPESEARRDDYVGGRRGVSMREVTLLINRSDSS
jgi:hypothetical protein